ncbi:MAG: PatB family C-S lyase [Gammaproteobacteria bacterium]|nr:PatB family C-S lyase [Gammaproteobacteria bacterium]
MLFDFDQIHDRSTSDSSKWSRYAGRDVLPMWVADSEFMAPPAVLAALQQRVAHGIFGYGRPSASLTSAIRHWCADRYQWQPEGTSLVYLPGLVPALHLVVRALGITDLPVLVPTPVYPPFFEAVKAAGRVIQPVPLSHVDGRWRLLPQVLERAISGRGQLLLFCNPHNPTGTLYRPDELAELAQLAADHDVLVCSDEIHSDLLLQPELRHQPFAAISEDAARRSIVLMAPSKSFNLAGLGCAWALIADPRLRMRFKTAMHGLLPTPNLLGLVAAEAALREGGDWLDQQCRYLHANSLQVAALWQRFGISHSQPQATYLSWVDLRALGLGDAAGWFEQHGVGLSDGAPFGAPGYLRLNFGCSRSQLDQGLARCAVALERAGVIGQ